MKQLALFVGILVAAPASAYDARMGDAVVDARSGLVGSSLDLPQMVFPRWRTGVTITHGWYGLSIPLGIGLVVGYEHQQRGYALIPRARATASMGLLSDSGLGVNAQLFGGFLWYATRSLGLGLSLGGNLWGNDLQPDLTFSLVQRW